MITYWILIFTLLALPFIFYDLFDPDKFLPKEDEILGFSSQSRSNATIRKSLKKSNRNNITSISTGNSSNYESKDNKDTGI